METVTLSSKYQLVIPRMIRRRLKIEAGQKFQVIEFEGRIELIPLKKARQLRGFLSGIKTDVPREKDRV